MGNMQARVNINKEAKKRVKSLKFGDEVTNICAGDKNPMRHCYFVRNKKDTAECTDKNGKFYDIYKNVVYPGHLSKEKCSELLKPVWQAEYSS